MNLFITSVCPVEAAKHHCDVHLRKMIVELMQMLSTAHYELDGHIVGYKPTHKNHPCSVWIRKSSDNYQWALDHLSALCEEYTYRTGKVHKTQSVLDKVRLMPDNICNLGLTVFPMAMPEKFKVLGIFDQTRAYKRYLNEKFKEWLDREKPIKVEWTNRVKPDWVEVCPFSAFPLQD